MGHSCKLVIIPFAEHELPFSYHVIIPECGALWFWRSQGFYGICQDPNHLSVNLDAGLDPLTIAGDRCVKFRTRMRRGKGNVTRGRPCGFLVAWVQEGMFWNHAHEHKTLYKFSWEDRVAARRYLATLPGGITLLRCERRQDEGEDEEHPDFR